MKVHHVPAALKDDPRFVLTTGWKMLAHTFREFVPNRRWDWRARRKCLSGIGSFGERSESTCEVDSRADVYRTITHSFIDSEELLHKPHLRSLFVIRKAFDENPPVLFFQDAVVEQHE
jgi:hypothetical protein